MQNERKRGADMIPEIHDKFIVMNWLREQKVGYDENFEKLPVRHQLIFNCLIHLQL